MLWLFKFPSYRAAVVERALGILLLSPLQLPALTASKEVYRSIRSHCALGHSIDQCAMDIVLEFHCISIRRDMPPKDAERVLLALAAWRHQPVSDHLAFREMILRGNLGDDPALARSLWLDSYLAAAQNQGTFSAEEVTVYAERFVKMLSEKAYLR